MEPALSLARTPRVVKANCHTDPKFRSVNMLSDQNLKQDSVHILYMDNLIRAREMGHCVIDPVKTI
jgi:hypothetical protein